MPRTLPKSVAMLAALCAAPAWATTWTVEAEGGGDFSSIQAAIDAAKTGDTIEIAAGSYNEAIDLGVKDLWLIGAGKAETVIDAEGSETFAVTVGVAGLLDGLTIRNGDSQGLTISNGVLTLTDVSFDQLGDEDVDGGAIVAERSTLSLTTVNFTDNYAMNGGAIWASGTDIQGDEVQVDGCSATEAGGGFFLQEGSSLTLTESTLTSNTAGIYGGAIYTLDGAVLSLETGTVSQNVASEYGGAIYGYNFTGGITLSDVDFTNNTVSSGYGGALYGYGASGVSISGSTFRSNHASGSGGALRLEYLYETLSISDSTFSENGNDWGHGGAIFASGYTDLEITDSSFSQNDTRYDGGAIYLSTYSASTLENVTFQSNTAVRSGGAIFLTPYQDGTNPQVFRNVSFYQNEAESSGGAVYARRVDWLDIDGSVFESNRASTSAFGGGLFVLDPDILSVRNNLFFNNSAGYGGAFYSNWYGGDAGDAVWSNNLFQENHANYGGVGCFQDDEFGEFSNNTLIGNAAQDEGAGLCLYNAWLDLLNNVFAENDGSALLIYDVNSNAYSTFTYNLFFGNAADADGELQTDTLQDGTNLFTDPLFARWSHDGVVENDALVPALGSPLIDAGSPTLLDPDGTVSDIGASGGPYALYEDNDNDGVYTNYDCDDDDATVFPGAAEIAYDGVDSNCDGASDYDQDGDGHDSIDYGGDDCDDGDPTVTVCAEGEEESKPCGCQVNPGRGASGLLAIALMGMVRRRTRPSAAATPDQPAQSEQQR